MSLEELAAMSEAAMVRRRFDERNTRWGALLAWAIGFSAFIVVSWSFGTSKATNLHRVVAVSYAAATLFIVASLSELEYTRNRDGWRPRPWSRAVARSITTAVVTMVVTSYAVLVWFAGGASGWVTYALIFPLLTLGFRLATPARAFLHAALLAISALAFFAAPKHPLAGGIVIGCANLAVFGISTYISRGLRRATIAEGMERRADARERLRIRDEFRVARELQLNMLPEAPPSLEWADVAGVSMPATEVGGDYYDYFVVGDRLAVVCGDVAGHGLASGITLSALRAGFTLLRDSLHDPADVLQQLQEVVLHSSRRRIMVTASVLLLDPNARTATIASAGHPPLLVIRDATRTVETIELFAPPLGARLGSSIPQRTIPFAPGDVFILHSDGIYETLDAAGDSYGLDRLGRIAAEATGTAEEIKTAILADVDAFRGAERQDDDVTIVVVRIA